MGFDVVHNSLNWLPFCVLQISLCLYLTDHVLTVMFIFIDFNGLSLFISEFQLFCVSTYSRNTSPIMALCLAITPVVFLSPTSNIDVYWSRCLHSGFPLILFPRKSVTNFLKSNYGTYESDINIWCNSY